MRRVNAILTVIMTLPLMAGTASAVSYFPLDNTAYVIQGGGGGTSSYLTEVDLLADPWDFNRTLPTPTTTWPVRINNLGFRVEGTGGLLYAIEWDGSSNVTPSLITIEADGTKTRLTTSGAAILANMNSGDISTDGNYMYLTNSGGAGTGDINDLYVVNLNTLVVSQINITGSTGNVNDFAYNPIDGYLYGGNQATGKITRLNPADGTRTDLGSAILPFGGTIAYGGTWFGPDGTLYLYRNATGGIYPVTDVTGTPTLGTVLAGGPTSVDVDAAAYAGKVPEPITLILYGFGFAGAGLYRRLRKKRSVPGLHS